MTLLIWATFILYSLGLVALDLGLFHRRPRPVSVGEAMMWTTLWVAMALLFNFLVFFLYDHHLMGSLTQPGSPATGGVAALEFFLGYLVEKALSLDNLVAVALIFACFEVPLQYQHRLLFWGILGALVIRGLVVALGVGLLSQFDWIIYGFGILLLVAALRRLVWRGKPITPENNPLLQLVKRFFPATIGFHGEKFFITQGGVKSVTPLFMALVLIEATDLMFALDSIPAIFSITRDPFIIYSSNVFAVLGLRPLYFVLAPIIQKLRYLRYSLIVLMACTGIKMLLHPHYPVSNISFLGVVLGILLAGTIASLLQKQLEQIPGLVTVLKEVETLADISYRALRRVMVLVLGTSVLLVGLAMVVLPGPAVVVIPIGLGILASEFAWARRLLKKARKKLEWVSQKNSRN